MQRKSLQKTERPKKRLTPRAMLEIKQIHEPQIHPDGNCVAFVVEEADFQESRWIRHIWLAECPPCVEVEEDEEATNPLDDETARQLTFSKQGETMPRWSPDGRFLAFLSCRPNGLEEDQQEEEPRPQIWVLPLEGGEAFKLTTAKEGVETFQWHPDGESLVFLTSEPKPEPIANALKDREKHLHIDPIEETEPRPRKQFWRVYLKDREPELLYTADPGVATFALSPEGLQLCYTTNRTGDPDDSHIADIFLLNLPTEGAPELHLLSDLPGGKYHLRWSPDGRALTFLGWLDPQLSFSRECLFGMRLPETLCPTAASQPISWLARLPEAPRYASLTPPEYDFDIQTYEWANLSSNADTAQWALFALATVRTGTELLRITDTTNVLPLSAQYVRYGLVTQPGGALLAWIEESAQTPPELYLLDPQARTHQLTKLNASLEKEYLIPKQEVVQWKSNDGLEIEGVLTYPLNYRQGELYPLLLQIHGGPKGCSQNSLRSYGMHAVWASEGYLVLRPNYRGSEGYGNAFAVSNRRDLGGGDYQDIMAGVDWCIAQGLADPHRMGVMGGSYGGYLTNWTIAHTDRFKAAISLFGIFHLQTDFSNSSYSRWDYEYLGAYYWEDPDIYRRLSPGTYVQQIKTPTLIIHGDEDENTFISNSKEMYQALKHRKIPVQFVHYPREGHGINEPNHRLDEMRRCLEWMARYLVPEGQPRVYQMRDTVRSQGWELCVTKAEKTRFLGFPPQNEHAKESPNLLEVVFTMQTSDKAEEAITLLLNDIRLVSKTSAEVWLPCGIATEPHGVRILVEGDNLRLRQYPDFKTGRIAFAVSLAFLVPKEGGEGLLYVASMPPVQMEWPSDEQAEEEI